MVYNYISVGVDILVIVTKSADNFSNTCSYIYYQVFLVIVF